MAEEEAVVSTSVEQEDGDQSLKPWEQQPNEPNVRYQAFVAYRDLGPQRSMDVAYRTAKAVTNRDKTKQTKQKKTRCSSTWWEWYREYDWKQRAQAYDVFVEQNTRKLNERAHREKIEAFLERQRQMAIIFQGVAIQMAQVARKTLQVRTTEDGVPGEHTLIPQKLPIYVRAAATLAQVSSDAEANALGLEELMNTFNESEN